MHDPDRDIDRPLAPFAKNLPTNLTIAMKSRISLSDVQILQHSIDIENADDGKKKDPSEPASLAEYIGDGEVGITIAKFG